MDSIYDFPAAELPDNVKLDLKWFAHEIAQSLVFDLGKFFLHSKHGNPFLLFKIYRS